MDTNGTRIVSPQRGRGRGDFLTADYADGADGRGNDEFYSLAPWVRRRSMSCWWSYLCAKFSGDLPNLSCAFMSAPFASSSSAISLCPPPVAECSGVQFKTPSTLMSAPFASNSLETSLCPLAAARFRG